MTVVLLALLLGAFVAYLVHLAQVVRDDDAGHAFSGRRPPASHWDS